MKSKLTRERLNKILNEDREDLNEPTRAAAHLAFMRVAREFFDTENVEMNVTRGKSGTEVCVQFTASRVKNFTVLK